MAKFLFKLMPQLYTAEKAQRVAGLRSCPKVLRLGDSGSRYVEVDAAGRLAIIKHLGSITPKFISIDSLALKALSDTSIAPTLGLDATLPQHRDTKPEPLQDEYPVLYFFYDTLAKPELLKETLDLCGRPEPTPAMIRRGKVKMWAGTCHALVEGSAADVVSGWTIWVGSKAHEDLLREYEGSNFEVVRCDILVANGFVFKGLTFRFCGDEASLEEVDGR